MVTFLATRDNPCAYLVGLDGMIVMGQDKSSSQAFAHRDSLGDSCEDTGQNITVLSQSGNSPDESRARPLHMNLGRAYVRQYSDHRVLD